VIVNERAYASRKRSSGAESRRALRRKIQKNFQRNGPRRRSATRVKFSFIEKAREPGKFCRVLSRRD